MEIIIDEHFIFKARAFNQNETKIIRKSVEIFKDYRFKLLLKQLKLVENK